MGQQLSLSARPKTLDALIGQDDLVARIRGHIASGRDIKAWLFTGPTGCGKTTVARIVALAMQCQEQTGAWGTPCKQCRESRAMFDIYEINCAKISGVRDLEEALSGAELSPRASAYRVYILDEVHMSSNNAQNLMLKYLEDSPDTTRFILCSTESHKLIPTLKGRCLIYKVRGLGVDDIEKLIARLLKKVGSDLPADRLATELISKGVTYPRYIAHAVEKYVAGAVPKEAADVVEGLEIDTFALTRAIAKGDWPDAAKYLSTVLNSDVRAVRLSVVSYFKAALLENLDINDRTNAIASAINTLVAVEKSDDAVMAGALCSAVYMACQTMFGHKL